LITVLVTGAGGGVGQGIIKCLKMIPDLEIRVIAADMSELSTGLYAGDIACLVERCTSPTYMDSLARIFDRYNVDFYMPGTDIELRFCAENKTRIKEAFKVETVISSLDTIDIADDKFKTFEFLKNAGLNYPKTKKLCDYSEGDFDFPVIVKPAVGCRSIGVEKITSARFLNPYLLKNEGLVIQECIEGEDREYTCTVVKVGDEISPVLVLKRELRSGDTYRANPVKSDFIEHYVYQIALKLDIEGGCNFQLRVDPNGVPKLFEINSRFSGTTPFCSQLGFNPLEYYLKKKIGHPFEVIVDYNAYVLRYWAEVVVQKEQMTTLATDGYLTPNLAKQFRLFD
jgi:carbamoyl-phosphate synthase large subunit